MSSETTMAAELKQLPDEVYRRYGFTPAKVEVEEHHVKVYAGKKTDEIVRAPHPECLLRGSLVSASLEATVMNAKYVNAVPLYRQEQEFFRYGLHISRQNMANWTIQCADRYLAVLYDYLQEKNVRLPCAAGGKRFRYWEVKNRISPKLF